MPSILIPTRKPNGIATLVAPSQAVVNPTLVPTQAVNPYAPYTVDEPSKYPFYTNLADANGAVSDVPAYTPDWRDPSYLPGETAANRWWYEHGPVALGGKPDPGAPVSADPTFDAFKDWASRHLSTKGRVKAAAEIANNAANIGTFPGRPADFIAPNTPAIRGGEPVQPTVTSNGPIYDFITRHGLTGGNYPAGDPATGPHYQHRQEGPDIAPPPARANPDTSLMERPDAGYGGPDPAAPAPATPADPNDPNQFPTTPPALPEQSGLSFEDYLKYFPDRDYSKNPAQDRADAYAAREQSRTALLAQLSFASGIVSGAGQSWQGLGTGFANAAGTYDKGFEKYQQALQTSADRYQRTQEQSMNYDTARRQAALTLYTNSATQQAENARLYHKEIWDRQGEILKQKAENVREGAKLDRNTINDYYAHIMESLKPTADDTPDEVTRKNAAIEQTKRAWQISISTGEISTFEPSTSDSANKAAP